MNHNTNKLENRFYGHLQLRKTLSLALIVLLILLSFPLSAIGSDLIALDVSEPSILEKDSAHIKGSVDVSNPTEQPVKSLKLEIQLYLKIQDQIDLVFENREDFSINQSETKKIEFDYKFKQKLIKGEYLLLVRIFQDSGIVMGYSSLNLGELGDEKSFLINDYNNTYFLLQSLESSSIDSEAIFMSGESPQLIVSLKNPSKINVEADVFAKVYKSNPETLSAPVFDDKVGSFKFEGEIQKDISLFLPAMTEANSYLVKITYKDKVGNTIADELDVRYVIKGGATKFISPKIKNIDDTIVFESTVDGVAEAEKLSDVNLIIKAFVAEQNEPAKSIEKKLELELNPIPINIEILKLEKDSDTEKDIKISAIITYKGNIWDSFNYVYSKNSKTIENPNTSVKPVFKDIVGTSYEQYVMPLYTRGLISGFEDNTFRPNENFTRAQFATMVCNLENIKDQADSYKSSNLFKDVSQNHWASGFINLIKSKDLMKGYPEGLFKPDAFISYSEVMTFLVRWIEKDTGIDKTLEWPNNYVKRGDELGIAVSSKYDIRGQISRGTMSELFWTAIQTK